MTEALPFNPAWTSPPGETIQDLLSERDLDVSEFAADLGYSEDDVARLIEGDLMIDEALATRLAATLGATTSFWLTRDTQYREDVERLQSFDSAKSTREWVRAMPVSQMRLWGWLDSTKEKQAACLEFFDVDNLAEWQTVYGGVTRLVAFRKSEAQSTSPSAVVAWLRQGEIEASKVACAPFSRQKLRESIPEIRALTRVDSPTEFLPRLTNICATAGVAIAIVRSPTGCGVSGAARFESSDKAIIQLSFRYRSDDHFWFTLFHEIGHLLLHSDEAVFLEGSDLISTQEEEEANRFSQNVLIPPDAEPELLALGGDYRKVMRFAKRIGVSPGIVVGQLQHRGLLPRNYLNKLRIRYDWT